jgi:fibronectin-binding autotransporter adhesin
VTLGGTLKVILLDPLDFNFGTNLFVPSNGNSFQIYRNDGGSIVGTFSAFDFSSAVLQSGLAWDTSNLYTTGFLGVVAVVPEPATYAAIFGAVALVGAAVVRRRRAKTQVVVQAR